MNKATILFAAIGLVLVGVAVTRTPGQQVVGAEGACCLPSGGCDLTMEPNCLKVGGVFLGFGTLCIGGACAPYGPPTVVGISTFNIASGQADVYRVWSDGRVDWVRHGTNGGQQCDQLSPCVIVPGSCLTDIDGNGDTGITDFLTLLGGWGPCP